MIETSLNGDVRAFSGLMGMVGIICIAVLCKVCLYCYVCKEKLNKGSTGPVPLNNVFHHIHRDSSGFYINMPPIEGTITPRYFAVGRLPAVPEDFNESVADGAVGLENNLYTFGPMEKDPVISLCGSNNALDNPSFSVK